MMGHKRPQYNDIRSKSPEFLSEQYMRAEFGITPRQKLSDLQVIEALLRTRGFDATKLLRTEAFDVEGYSEPHRLTVEDRNIVETRQLADLFARSVSTKRAAYSRLLASVLVARGEIRAGTRGHRYTKATEK